ncbi:MAG: hypothetical protein BWX64_01823 [Acidobacteria bacterium ADurb.Bin051]|nr:MAG: hypothetical protein BWX64_01823 [Acidobacteria bacterium ADurb.Bin051]
MRPTPTALPLPTAAGQRVTLGRLRTIAQLAAESGGLFTEGALRWHVFNATETGLARAIVRVGRRVYIDVDEFERWLGEQRAG